MGIAYIIGVCFIVSMIVLYVLSYLIVFLERFYKNFIENRKSKKVHYFYVPTYSDAMKMDYKKVPNNHMIIVQRTKNKFKLIENKLTKIDNGERR